MSDSTDAQAFGVWVAAQKRQLNAALEALDAVPLRLATHEKWCDARAAIISARENVDSLAAIARWLDQSLPRGKGSR